jgi:cytochrome c-type biogenesis protein CcmH/NrfF
LGCTLLKPTYICFCRHRPPLSGHLLALWVEGVVVVVVVGGGGGSGGDSGGWH